MELIFLAQKTALHQLPADYGRQLPGVFAVSFWRKIVAAR
jgi:hypothetical protein